MAAEVGLEPTNSWFRARRLYQFVYSALLGVNDQTRTGFLRLHRSAIRLLHLRPPYLAEGVGFEPTGPLRALQFSRLVHSASMRPFHIIWRKAVYSKHTAFTALILAGWSSSSLVNLPFGTLGWTRTSTELTLQRDLNPLRLPVQPLEHNHGPYTSAGLPATKCPGIEPSFFLVYEFMVPKVRLELTRALRPPASKAGVSTIPPLRLELLIGMPT